jgi:hypothetical protein
MKRCAVPSSPSALRADLMRLASAESLLYEEGQ